MSPLVLEGPKNLDDRKLSQSDNDDGYDYAVLSLV